MQIIHPAMSQPEIGFSGFSLSFLSQSDCQLRVLPFIFAIFRSNRIAIIKPIIAGNIRELAEIRSSAS